jgi:hypothetical protein
MTTGWVYSVMVDLGYGFEYFHDPSVQPSVQETLHYILSRGFHRLERKRKRKRKRGRERRDRREKEEARVRIGRKEGEGRKRLEERRESQEESRYSELTQNFWST